MSATSPDITVRADTAAPTVSPDHDTDGAGFTTAATATAKRSILQFFRTPQVLVMGSIQGALFLFMFRYVFGGAISTSGARGSVNVLRRDFLVPVTLWPGLGTPAALAEACATGVYARLGSLPIPRSSVMVGRSIADITLVVWGFL